MQKNKYYIDAGLDAEFFLDVFEKRKLLIIQQIDNNGLLYSYVVSILNFSL